jgi:hypothetical protein
VGLLILVFRFWIALQPQKRRDGKDVQDAMQCDEAGIMAIL